VRLGESKVPSIFVAMRQWLSVPAKHLLLVFCTCGAIVCSTRVASAENKAFVVGLNYKANANKELWLNNSAYSAEQMATTLTNYGYKTTWLKDETRATLAKFDVEWRNFLKSVDPADQVVIYFSGHGLSTDDGNYLVPLDVNVNEIEAVNASFDDLLIPLSKLVADMSKKSPAAVVWVIDACRNNNIPVGRHLQNAEVPPGHLALYAAGYNETALDGLPTDDPKRKVSSLYTRTLLQGAVQFPKKNINDVFTAVKARVSKLALSVDNHKQNPVPINNLDVVWCFTRCENAELIELAYTTANSYDFARSAAALVAEKSLLKPQIAQNVVYLGKKSRVADCESKPDDTHPFGCSLLTDLVGGKYDNYLSKSVLATTDINVRSNAPIVIRDKSYKGCPVHVLKQGDQIELNGILKLVYAGDTFYWGTVGGNLQACLTNSG